MGAAHVIEAAATVLVRLFALTPILLAVPAVLLVLTIVAIPWLMTILREPSSLWVIGLFAAAAILAWRVLG